MESAWSFRRGLLLSVTIPVLWAEGIRLQAGHRRWVKVLSPAWALRLALFSSTNSGSPGHA
jgi:hypothetical protein